MLSLTRKGDCLNGVRFRPGCFLATIRSGGLGGTHTGWSSIIAPTTGELAITPGLQGVQNRYGWAWMEPTEGVYDFSEIISNLSDLRQSAADGGDKLLSIVIQAKTFSDTDHVVPTWMRNSTYGNGELQYNGGAAGTNGFIIRFNDPAVQAKFALLAAAMGRALANEAQIELIGITEMSMGTLLGGQGLTQLEAETGHFEGGVICLKALKTAFPRTIIRQILNYPKTDVAANMADYVANGIAIGGTDCWQDEIQLEQTSGGLGIYNYMRTYGGVIPTIMEYQNKTYNMSNLARRINPANGWAASVTVSDAGGGNTLLSSATVNHGLSTSVTNDYLNVDGALNAILRINTTGGGWAVQNLDIVSVPTVKNIVVSYTYGGETAPTGMLQAAATPYPLTNQTYVPNANTYTGYDPTIDQLVKGFTKTDFPHCNYFIFTRTVVTSSLDNEDNPMRVRKYINGTLAKYGEACFADTVRPTSIA